MKISIVIPSYNQGRYLRDTLASVAAQRREAHEVFVYDGGSTDDSVEIIRQYEAWIDHWESGPDGGQTAALESGFSRATGEILHWLNSDDVLLPGALASVRKAFARHPDWDIVKGNGVFIDEAGTILRVRRDRSNIPFWAWWGVLDVIQPATFFRRRAYEAAGGLDPAFDCAMDTDLWYRFFQGRAKWGAVHDYLAAVRIHSEAKGTAAGDTYREERARLRAAYPEYAGKNVRDLIGHPMLYAANLASGDTFCAIADNRRCRGRHYATVFGGASGSGGSPDQADKSDGR